MRAGRGSRAAQPAGPQLRRRRERDGFDEDTLREFFTDGHDLPFAMTIMLEEDEADIAVSHVIA